MDGIIPMITEIATLIGVVLAVWVASKVKKGVDDVHVIINSRMDELLKETRKASHAKGRKQERDHPHSPDADD